MRTDLKRTGIQATGAARCTTGAMRCRAAERGSHVQRGAFSLGRAGQGRGESGSRVVGVVVKVDIA